MTTLSQVGEFGLIDQIKKGVSSSRSIVCGVGDDTAVVKSPSGLQLLTTDMLVEDVHFTCKMSPLAIGHKALACSISDVAAMGGQPQYALISLGAPANFSKQFILTMYRGLQRTAKKFGVHVVGGDTVKSNKLTINVALTGEVASKNLVTRKGARPGDQIFVTGPLGKSFTSGWHLKFIPRVKEAHYLVKYFKPTAMMDISDGLAADLGHVLKASGVGAVIEEEKVPRRQKATLQQALHDGEDFELLFTLSSQQAQKLTKQKLPFKFFFIGGIVKEPGLLHVINKKGKARNISPKGFEHFKP